MAGRFALVVAMVISALVAAEGQQEPRRPARDVLPGQQAPEGTSAIAGKITARDSGRPLRMALIRAVGPGGTRQIQTTEDGLFEFRELRPGAWKLTITRGGYLTQEYGQSRPQSPGQPIVLAPQQRVAVDVSLMRASAIAGRVYDEYGDPVTQARVNVLRPRMIRHRRYLEPLAETDLTDDTGAFRVFGLAPGDYYVTASAVVAPPGIGGTATLAPTFYPGTADFGEAKKVSLALGKDARVEFPLVPVRNARVSGMVLSSGDYAQSLNRFVSLASEAGDLGTVPRISGATRDDGTFSLPDVPPGAYTLIAEVRSPTTIAEIGSVAVTVDGSNLDGITVTTAKAGTLRGTIVADAGVTRRLPPKFDVYARPRLPATDNTFASAEAGAFELVAPPGPFTIEAAVPDGWMVKSITIGGVDASEFAIDIGREQNMPVTVVLTDRVTTMTGTVTGDQAGGAYVVVFPAESGNWTSRRIRRARTDTRGRFRISGLPAGDRYLAVAVDRLDEGDEEDPDFLRKVQDYATSFDLRPDEAPNVTVKVFER